MPGRVEKCMIFEVNLLQVKDHYRIANGQVVHTELLSTQLPPTLCMVL